MKLRSFNIRFTSEEEVCHWLENRAYAHFYCSLRDELEQHTMLVKPKFLMGNKFHPIE